MFGFLIGLNLRVIAIVCAVVLTFGAGWTVNGWRLNHKIEKEHLAQLQAIKDKEAKLQTETDSIRRTKDAQINAINNQLFAALSELRKRPSRSQSANNGQNGTGATLFAEDAEFLIGEAARADKLRTALDACYQQYDAINNVK